MSKLQNVLIEAQIYDNWVSIYDYVISSEKRVERISVYLES